MNRLQRKKETNLQATSSRIFANAPGAGQVAAMLVDVRLEEVARISADRPALRLLTNGPGLATEAG